MTEAVTSEVKPPQENPLATRQSKIIKDIVTSGLKAGTDLKGRGHDFVPSADTEDNEYVDGLTFTSQEDYNGHLFQGELVDGIKSDLYGGRMSIFTILAERRGERLLAFSDTRRFNPQNHDMYEQRMRASFLVVTHNPGHRGTQAVPVDEVTDFVFPEEVYRTHKELIDAHTPPEKLRVVGYTDQTVRGVFDQTYNVPNYEQILNDYASKDEKIFIHAVRLPTLSDLAADK